MAKTKVVKKSRIRLSTYMLRGCKLRGQNFGGAFSIKDLGQSDDDLKSCALGSVFEARFKSLVYRPGYMALAFPALCNRPNGGDDDDYRNLSTIIIDMNDQKKLSREKIAEWLKSIGQ